MTTIFAYHLQVRVAHHLRGTFYISTHIDRKVM
jgi:hypothetical protein